MIDSACIYKVYVYINMLHYCITTKLSASHTTGGNILFRIVVVV